MVGRGFGFQTGDRMGTDAVEAYLREMQEVRSTGGQVSERIGKGACGWGDGRYNERNSRGRD